MWVKGITICFGLVFTLHLGLIPVGLVHTQDLPPINNLSLNPNASHVCSSVINEYYYITETYTEYVRYKTYTWCFSIPPRCTDWRNRPEQRSRTVRKSRQRKAYFCCQGYETHTGANYCYPKCKDKCNSHGLCILPGSCNCYQGYQGEFCQLNCSEGYYGPNCEQKCACSEHGSCDPATGNCICHIGYTGNDCSTQCQGAFGPGCIHQCVCQNNASCDPIDGHCTCKPGFHGLYCQFRCQPGEPCDTCNCQNGGTCEPNGDCVCRDGYSGRYCTEKCDDQHWGQNCSEVCEPCYNGRCDKETGVCLCDMGFGGEHCQMDCKPRYYGNDCGVKCSCENNGSCYYSDAIRTVRCNCSGTGYHGDLCHNRDCDVTEFLVSGQCQACDCPWETAESCNVLTGACQCEPGYHGDKCQDKCEMPFYGQDCSELCIAKCPHGECDHITGECTSCYSGWQGKNCTEKCPKDTWGLNCTQACQCVNGATCSHTTGYCNCTNGYQGLYCAQRCPQGTFGYNCSGTCQCHKDNAICSLVDGHCQCLPGYHGNLCTEQCAVGTYGYQCQSNCSCNENGTRECDHRTGECKCKGGYKGVECDSQCDKWHWGENCQQVCECNSQGSCDQLTGKCICYAGYIGPKCSQECPNGKYGFGCQETCQPCPDHAVCDFKTGECPRPGVCPAGFTGADCEDLCEPGFWGLACNMTCAETCSGDRGRCNPINGKCRCFPGYRGLDCEFECEQGKYGIACQEDCECVMEQTQKCNHKSGTCACRPGFRGIFCQNQCQHPTWGPECRFNCSAVCNTKGSTGRCNFIMGIPCDCHVGYQGDHCETAVGVSITDQQTGEDTAASAGVNPIIIAVIVIALILILVIVLIVIYFGRRIRKLKEDNLQVAFNANGMGTYENGPSENHTQIGLVNPTYESENLNNEARYPHLSARARPNPLPLPTTTKVVEDSCDRRTSGCYDDPDEDRYTSLKALENQQSFDDEGAYQEPMDVNIQRPTYDSKLSDKYTFYTGPKVPNTEAATSRSQNPRSKNPRSPSSSNDARSRPYDDSYLKPNNLLLAQQTTITNPSPITTQTSIGEDDSEDNIQLPDDSDLQAIAFENNRFMSGMEPGVEHITPFDLENIQPEIDSDIQAVAFENKQFMAGTGPNVENHTSFDPENPDEESLAFVNREFQATTNVSETPDTQDATRVKQRIYDNAELNGNDDGQMAVPNVYTSAPVMPLNEVPIYDNTSLSSGSQESLNTDNDNRGLMNSMNNPYDLPIPLAQRESDSSQPLPGKGYLTPSSGLRVDTAAANHYDTPRTSGTDASPYDTPRSIKFPKTDTENMSNGVGSADLKKALLSDLKKVQRNKSVGSETSNGPNDSGNWVSFDEKDENRLSFA